MKSIAQHQVMSPVELSVSAKILEHPQGKSARLMFDYLLVESRIGHGLDREGFVVVSQAKLDPLGISSNGRRRGLAALESLGLVELRQEGQGAYRARLLYQAPKLTRNTKSSKPQTRRPVEPIDMSVYETLRAMNDVEG